MLRDNTEDFARDLWNILKKVGINESEVARNQGFQLMKFDRLSPDVFVWLVRNDKTYIVSISDIEGDHPDNQFLAEKWLGGRVATDQITTLFDDERNMYIDDGFDTVIVRQLSGNYDLDMDESYAS